jgi:hypothetical protein
VGLLAKEDDIEVKRLAEMKAYLERRIAESQQEVERLRSFLEAVDSLLAERSFRPVKIPAEAQAIPTAEKTEAVKKLAGELWPLTSPEGVHLADLQITESEIVLVPDSSIRYDVASPPLRAFLIARVLDPMSSKDQEAVRNGQLSGADVLSYQVEEDSGVLKTLRVQNYRDQARLGELRNAIRWTIRRMYEKTLQTR